MAVNSRQRVADSGQPTAGSTHDAERAPAARSIQTAVRCPLSAVRWRSVARVAAALALFCGVVAAGVVAGELPDRLQRGRGAAGAVPDTLLQMTYDMQTRQETVLAYLPGTKASVPLLAGGSGVMIAPDGRQVIFTQRRPGAGGVQYAVVAFASDSLTQQWRAVVADGPPEGEQSPPITVSTEVTADRVYVVTYRWRSADLLAIVALDRADGAARARWTVDLAGKYARWPSLRAAPDGTWLALRAGLSDTPPNDDAAAPLAYFRFALPDGRELERRAPLVQPGGNEAFFNLNGRIAPDGRTLYDLSYASSPSAGVAVRFFDLATGAILPPLALPFPNGPEFLPYESAVSADGQRLFILAPTLRTMLIVNLLTRAIEEQFQLDTRAVTQAAGASRLARVVAMVRGFFVQAVAAKPGILGTMQFSPDGRTLYAIGATTGLRGNQTQDDGIWAIDTQTWRVTNRWLPGAAPYRLLLSGDGRYLTAALSGGGIRTLETATGNVVRVTDRSVNGTLVSLPELFRERYGRSPAVTAAAALRAAPPFAMLAVAATTPTILAGEAATVEARFTDPLTGAPVTPGMTSARYRPPATVTASFCRYRDAACDPPVPLQAVGYGVYRGSAPLVMAGTWSVQALAQWNEADLPDRQALSENGLNVQAAYVGTDGNRYRVQVTTDPPQPVKDRPATVRVAFVDAARGTPLPAGVRVLTTTPAALDASFFPADGYLRETLRAVGNGVYAGTVTFWAAGSWPVSLQIPLPNGVEDTVPVGAVTVGSG